jgi:hypothetical protein
MSVTQQQVFTLSWLVNGAAIHKWNAADLNTQLQNTYKQYIGGWEIVWGPYLYFPNGNTGGPVGNAMFVAQGTDSDNSNTYVVAVAGTNESSVYDWFTEDLDVTPLDWPYATDASVGTMQVTTGDNVGLSNLLAMTSITSSSPTVPVTLQAFLHGVAGSGADLWITGHSLGGALAPMLTLALMDPNSTLNAQNNVSIGNWGQVSLLATAGPSMGNQAFVTYFNQTLSAASLTFIWNGHDIVPHAWNAASMQALTTPTNIFDLDLDPSSCLAKALARLQGTASQNSYVMFDTNPGFTCDLQPYTKPKFALIGWNPQSQFLAQAAFQHINAYVEHFGCTWFTPSSLLGDPGTAYTVLSLVNANLAARGYC